MAKVLTADARVTCSHQGTVKVAASQHKLKVDGRPVLVLGDMEGRKIDNCGLQPSTSTTPCTAVVSTARGAATKLRAGSKPVLLDTAIGITNSVPPGTWKVQSAGQSKLTAS
jgi:hypothetical protein